MTADAVDSGVKMTKIIHSSSLALVIVSLININNWPYLGINNFQLMKQRMWTGSRGWVPMGQMIFSWIHNDPRSSIISWHGILIGFGPFPTYPGPSRSSRLSIQPNGDKIKLQNLLWSHTWPNLLLMGITTFWHRLLMCINYKIGHLWDLGDLECWILGQFWGINKTHILPKTIVGDNRGKAKYFWLVILMRLGLVVSHFGHVYMVKMHYF